MLPKRPSGGMKKCEAARQLRQARQGAVLGEVAKWVVFGAVQRAVCPTARLAYYSRLYVIELRAAERAALQSVGIHDRHLRSGGSRRVTAAKAARRKAECTTILTSVYAGAIVEAERRAWLREIDDWLMESFYYDQPSLDRH